jgi:hypothetical protein
MTPNENEREFLDLSREQQYNSWDRPFMEERPIKVNDEIIPPKKKILVNFDNFGRWIFFFMRIYLTRSQRLRNQSTESIRSYYPGKSMHQIFPGLKKS